MSHSEYLSDAPEFVPSPLPPELAAFLKDQDYACLTHATDRGTVFVIKAPSADIHSVRGRIPIHLRHELYDHPAAPVIRMVMTMYDTPEAPIALETFINVEDPYQRTDFAALAAQEELRLLFYDETLTHRLTKAVALKNQEAIAAITAEAERLYTGIAPEQFDFDAAKRAVMAATSLL